MNTPDATSHANQNEVKWVILLSLLAALHVFIFTSAFPFFNSVDEQLHFDLAVCYSQGDLPRSLTPPSAEALAFIAVYGTPEYLWPPSTQPGGRIEPPPWTLPISVTRKNLLVKEAIWKERVKNHEASQPPLYYAVAGAWWRLGKLLHFDGLTLLYWLRFLNVPFIALLVWLGGLAARKTFPENYFIRLAVPALIAFMPQSIFYAINNDVFSPLTFGLVFILLMNAWGEERLSPGLAASLGLALAATFLTKISNLPLLAVAGIFLAAKIFQLAQTQKLRASIAGLALLAFCAGLPMAAWMAWCKASFGDFTGSALKIQFLGWIQKPLAEWFHHPIFSVSGFWYFLKGNLSSFWQGEILWQRRPMAIPAVDLVYVMATLGLLALIFYRLLRPREFGPRQQVVLWFAFMCLVATFTFFALLSVKYDFQNCFYPSRAYPFFVSGRLMLGMLIPFLILFACGLDRLLKSFPAALKFIVLFALLAFMLVAEIIIDWPIFPNEYNWYHL